MTPQNTPIVAPELEVTDWLNTDTPISLAGLRGRVVLIEAFQMLCPGCVSHSLPQASKVTQLFKPEDVTVLGLHTVFEHHSAQGTKEALSAFMHEYRIPFPVGIDAPSPVGTTPKTMTKYSMRGTPTTILIDRNGILRKQSFGRVEDMVLGAELMALVSESALDIAEQKGQEATGSQCDENGCPIPGI